MTIIGPTTNHGEIEHWAMSRGAVPVEVFPQVLDSEPAVIQFMRAELAAERIDLRLLLWEEFFLKFDELRLSFVYDEGKTGYNEILQIEEESPYRHPAYRPQTLMN